MVESAPAAQDAEPAPLMNGHADHDSEHCNGVDPAEGPHSNHSADGDPADGAPEYLQDMPELISDEEDDNVPIPTFQTDQEWRQAIASFRVKGAVSSRSTPFSPDSVLDFDQTSVKTDTGSESGAQGQAAGEAASSEKAKKGAPSDKAWLRMMELEEQKKLDQDGRVSAEEVAAGKAAAEAEAQRNLELRAEERRRLRAEQGLDGTSNDLILAQCALRPGVVEDAVCEKADDGRSIKGSQKHMKIVCTEGCTIHYHYACWRAFERAFKVQHPEFSWKNKDGVRCFTDGCTGNIKLALELQSDMGTEISRRELLRLPDEPKRAAHPPPQAEPKKARKQKGAQKAPAADAEEGKAKAEARPTRQALVERAPVAPAPAPKPEVKVEPAPPPALDFPDISFVQRKRDDEEDLERLEKGLKGKKEKKRREKKGKNVVHVLPDAETAHEEEPESSNQPQSYAEHFMAADDPAPRPTLNSKDFPGLTPAAAAGSSRPILAPAPALTPARPSADGLSAWETILCLQSARPGPHLLIQNVDVQSLQAASKPPAAHIEKMVLQYGLFAALVVFPGLAAAAVSYTSSSAGEQAYFKLDGKLLEKKRLELSFLEQYPSHDMIANVASESGTPALQKRATAEQFEETGAAAGVGSSGGSGNQPQRSANVEIPRSSQGDKDRLTMQGLMRGANVMGLEGGKANQLRVAAREFVPSGSPASNPAEAAPLAVSATPSEAGATEPTAAQVEADLAVITCMHLLGCNEAVLGQYNQQERFGISLEDLADHSSHDVHSMGLVLYDIDTHELHGLWRAKRVTHNNVAGQVIAFEVLQKFPPISRDRYSNFLGLEEDGSLNHPQLITGNFVKFCIQQFQKGTASAPSPGRAGGSGRSIKAAIKAAASPLKPDVAHSEPPAPAPSARPVATAAAAAAAAAPAVAPPLFVPAARLPVPAAPAPPAPAAPTAGNLFSSLFEGLFPKEAPAAAPAPQPQQAAPAAPLAVQTAASGSQSSSASGTPRPSSASTREPDRAARMATFYGMAQASPQSRAQITNLLQSSALNSHSSLEMSLRQPAPETTLAAAAQSLAATAVSAPEAPAVSQAAAQPSAAAPAPVQPTAPSAPAAKPPVRLMMPAGRPAYRPPAVGVRPYRPPNAPVPLQPAPQQQQPEPQRPQAAAAALPSITDLLMSNIQPAPSRPSGLPAARPPQPNSAHRSGSGAEQQADTMSRTSSGTSLNSEAASMGSTRRLKVCPLCQEREGEYMVLPCRHLGPCCTCMPPNEDKTQQKRRYPKCMACQLPADMLLRIFGN